MTTSLTLASGQGLKATGTATTGTITTSAAKGLTTAANSPLNFTAFNGTNAPLTISGAGTVTLASGNTTTVTVSNGGIPLIVGDYVLINKGASGSVAGIAPSSVTVNGDGIAPSTTASLQITGSQLVLHVALPAPASLKYRSKQTGNWNDFNTWQVDPGTGFINAVATQTPTSANDTITIQGPHLVTVTASVNADQLTVNTGGLLSVNNGVTFTLDDGAGTDLTVASPAGLFATAGNVTNNGQAQINSVLRVDQGGFPGGGTGTYAYDQTTGTLAFNNTSGSFGVNNFNFWPTTNAPQNVSVASGGITMNVARTIGLTLVTSGGVSGAGNLTINGLFNIFTGGFVSGSPIYGSASTLQYSTGGTYNRAGEWLAVTSGAGYPANVQVSANTTLDIANGITFNTAPSQMAGNLTIDSGSTLTMAAMTQPLKVLGNITTDGTLTLSTTAGGDLKIGGNFARSASGVFTPNNRAVFFEGAGTQSVTDAGGAISIPYVVVNKTGGTVSLNATDVTTLAPSGGASINFVGGTSTFTLNGRTLTLGSSIGNTPAGSGFIGDASAKMSLQDGGSAGSMGTLTFVGGSENLQNLTVNRTGGAGTVILGSNLTVGGTLALTAGQVLTGANTLTVAATGTATRTSGYIVGNEQKNFNAPASFTFHVGTANGYSPVDANSTTGTGSLAVKPTEAKQPNVAGANALSRYWTLTGSSITTNLTFHYLAGDVAGTEADYKIFKYSGGSFTQFTPTNLDTTNHTATLNGVSSFSDWTLAEAASVFGQLQFSAANYDDTETNSGTHNAIITVQRTGGTSGAVSVHYATSAGTATNGTDYDDTSGDLNWADGDAAAQTFNVVVHGDATFEPDETVNLTLSAPTGGATSGSPATLTIKNDDVAPPPPIVYVDDDFTGANGSDPDGAGPATSIGYDAFQTIQGGATGVAASGIVNVAAGTYTENVTIAKSLTLTGAGEGVVTLRPALSAPNPCAGASLCPGASNLILVQADNVTISGLTLDGDNTSLTSGIVRAGADLDARNGIITNHTLGVFQNLTVHHTTIKNIYLRGVYASTGGTFNFHHDTVQNVQGEGASIGMFNFGGAGQFDNNNASDCNDAIASNHSRGTQFTNNTVTTSASAIHTDNAGDQSGSTSDTISNNTVTNSQQFGFGIWTFVPTLPVTVSNNTVTNVEVGLSSAGGQSTPVASTFTGNTVDGQNRANSAGVYLTTDQFGFGQGNNLVVFQSNTVKNNVDGFVLEANATAGPVTNPATNRTTNQGRRFPASADVNETGRDIVRVERRAPASAAAVYTLTVNADFNRVVGNTSTGLSKVGAGTLVLNFENNWWGCNAGPNQTGCQTVDAVADFSPWLVLGVSASPNPIAPGGTTTVTADMTHNSDNALASSTVFIPATPVSFSATQGNVSPTGGTITNGQATTTFTSTSGNSGTASATVDNQTSSTNVNVTSPSFSIDDVAHNEGNSGTTSYTFTVTKTGTTPFASSVDFTTVDGTATTANSDYQSNSGTLNFASGDATMQIVVLVNGDTTVEPDEAFTVHLSNASGAIISDADGTGTITNDDAPPPPPPNVVYVDDDWTGTTPGTDPDGTGPATSFGYDAFAKIQDGVNGVAATGGTVNVYAGTYDEDVNVNKAGLSLLGAGAATTTVRGPIGGPGTTIQISASNVTVAGFTVTRLGNNTTDWNNPGLNTPGFAIQGLSITNALIRDNVITGMRTGIDINNSGGHTVRNNVIDFNRTGFIFRNQTDQMTVVENFITNNWTVGVLFLDASSGSNVPVQTALHSTFSNNNISANWYGQIVDRQTGGSLPAPNTTNTKNFRGNWYGTTSPVVTTANSAEPGYAAQIPTAYGGSATPPGGQPDIAGPASANFKYQPFLLSGTDTNVETTPGRGTNGFQGVQNTSVVSPANQQGWVFFDDNPGVGTGSGGFENGPATPPLGVGSAFLQVDSQGRHALGTAAYAGTRMDDMTGLSYDSYQDNNANTVVAISLQFDIDYDLNDPSNTFQGRLVFEPYLSPAQGAVQQNVWQNWDARAGNWYGTRTTVTVNNVAGVAQPCQPATPCTWQQVLTLFPNAGVRNTPTSAMLFKAGGPWSPGFDGNVDAFRITVNTAQTTYDFEPLPSLSIDDVTHNEGNAGTTAYTFTVTLSRAFDQTVTVNYATADDSATNASGDYQPKSGTLTFIPGETSKQFTVDVNGDTAAEADEQFFVNLSSPSNATVSDPQGVGTITNDDTEVTVSVSPAAVAEDGATNLVYTFTRNGITTGAITVGFGVGGTATFGTDYGVTGASSFDGTTGTVEFSSGQSTAFVTVDPTPDSTYESDETVTLTLAPGAGYGVGSPSAATGTISNDDPRPLPNVVYVDDDWASVPNGSDPDGAGPATEMGYDAFSTVQGGVTGVAPGGTVNVYAGNYPEQVTISKSLTLIGAGAATTNITTPASLNPGIGGNLVLVQVDSAAVVDMSGITVAGPRNFGGCSAQIFYGVFVAGAANLNLHDAAVKDIRMANPALFGCQDGIAVRAGSQALAQTATLTLNLVSITGYQKGAVVVDGTGTTATITNNTITGFGPENLAQNAVQIGRNAGATVTGNTITGNECNNPVCGPDPFTQAFGTGVLIFSTGAPVNITNNTISNNDTGVYNNGANTTISGNTMVANRFNGIFLDEGSATISNNNLSGASNVGVTAVSFVGNGGNSVGTLDHNNITGATTGLQMLDDTSGSDAFVPQLTAHFNRIVATTTAIDNPQSATADLENNWWGCNNGPGNTGCGAVTGTGADFNPWFVLLASATPDSIVPGGSSNVAADMTHNSDGVVPAGTLPDLPVSFSATNGTMSPTSATVQNGAANSTFTSTNSSNAVATVTVDNQSVNVPITVTPPSFTIDDVTHNEGNAGTTSYTFTVIKTGATNLASSVDFATADGTATTANNDYQSNSGTLNFAAGDTTKQFTVLVNGDTTYEANETFFVNLSNPAGATITDGQGVGTVTNDDKPPATLVVNTTDDNNDGFCLADHCSLREAINASNVNIDVNTITFAIPTTDAGRNVTTGVYTIAPTSALPTATRRVTIDGYTQTPCSSNPAPCSKPNTLAVGDDAVLLIELNGTGAGANVSGLTITAGVSTVSGLVINRFEGHGIALQSSGSNVITGNFIGTDSAGTAALGNGGSGIAVVSGSGNTVGGAAAAARNIVSANDAHGVQLTGSSTVQGNYIGTDATGTVDLGNTGGGIVSLSGFSHVVGGAGVGEGNLISGNEGDGIAFVNNNSVLVQGNLIGTKADGVSALGNGANGVSFSGGGSLFNTVGGTAAGEANTIVFNGGDAVHIDATAGFAHTVRGNSIYSNGTTPAHLGIDLDADGVTPNDGQDADTGANNLQNFPVITAALVTGSTKTITGTLNSTPNQSFEIDFYANATCDASGNGEGQTYLGSVTTATSDANGDVSFTFHPTSLTTGQTITATATDAGGNTSEFSSCATVASGTAGAIQFASANYLVSESGGTASITVTRTGGSDGSITAFFSTSDGTATAPADYDAVASQSVTYADGETGTKSVSVTINQDTLVEGDETVNLSLSTTTINIVRGVARRPAVAPSTSATLTINDDEPTPTLSIGDVFVSEPQSGTSNATFTVTLSAAAEYPVSVNYATADGTAQAPADYDATSGTLNFAPGETSKPITVVVKSDALNEGKETFTVNLSNASAPVTISDASATGTIIDPVLNGQIIISEFRFRGANGAQDEFVELYNNTTADITVATEDGTPGWALAAILPDGASVDLLATIPNGTIIRARAHYLLADAPSAVGAQGYSLGVTPNLTYDCDIDDGAGVALFRTNNTASFSTATRLDAAGFSNLATPLADLFREGAGLTSPGANDGEYSFVRNPLTGFPQDTNDNAADFKFVATDGGVYGTVPATLGAPGPERSGDPTLNTSKVKATLVDPGCPGTSTTPGDACARYRDTTSSPSTNSTFGTLSLRRTFTNSTSHAVTRLRFRVIDITTRAGGASPAPGTADLRVLTSQTFTATKTGGEMAIIRGLTLEEPPTQAIGGGLNSTLAAGTITLGTPLAPSASINVDFRFGIEQPGSFRAFVIVEALFDGPVAPSTLKSGPQKATAPIKFK